MKQRITVNQINELSDAQKQRLRELWDPQVGDSIITTGNYRIPYIIVDASNMSSLAFINSGIGVFGNSKDNCLPLLSIGQMIEILANNKGFYQRETITSRMSGINDDNDLCDALWRAVKEIL